MRLTTSATNTSPALSPDGTRIAFIRAGDVWTMDIDGSGLEQVTETPAAEQTPVWSPDADAHRLRRQGRRRERPGDPGPRRRRTGGPTQLTDNTFPDTDPAWSPPLPGRPHGLIAFVSARTGDSDRNIYVMDSRGGSVANLTPPGDYAGVPYQGHDDAPSWSPDGRMAFTHTFLPNAGGLPAIWTVAADGSGLSRLSTDPTQTASEPAWSPDGQRIAYVGTVGTDRNIAVMAADGTGSVQIDTTVSHDIAPDWQEDSVDPETTIAGAPSGSVVRDVGDRALHLRRARLDLRVQPGRRPAFSACVSPRTWTQLASARTRRPDPRRRPRGTAGPLARDGVVERLVAERASRNSARPPPAPPTPPAPTAAASVASIVRLDSTRGRVPATVSVSPAGSKVRLSVFARVSDKWVRVGNVGYAAETAGTAKARVTVGRKWRPRLAGQRVKAKLVVAVTSPTGVTVDAVERFRLGG